MNPVGVIPRSHCQLALHCSLAARPQSRPAPPVRGKPVLVQALIAKPAVEPFNKRVPDRLPRLDEVQRHPMLSDPRIQQRP